MRREQETKSDRLDRIEDNLTIRSETPPDYPQITQVNNLAFGQENEAKLIEKIRLSDRYISELSIVAELDNRIVAHIMFSYINLVALETTQVLALAPVAVLPEYQNQGIGSLLVKTGLKIAEEIQIPMVIVLGEPKFYHRFGFKPAVNYGIQSPFDVPDKYFMVKFLSKNCLGKTGKIIYPDTFKDV